MRNRCAVAAVALATGAGAPALAADIRVNPPQAVAFDCDATVTGEIRTGDAARLERALDPLRGRENRTVCLNSTGGAYNEGIALADLFRRFAFTTRLLPGARCFSSCAVAFMGGTREPRSGEDYSAHRLMSPRAQLGFHAPYLRLGGADFNEENVRGAYRQATRSIGRLLATSLRVDLDLKLIEEMLARGEDELYMIDTVARLGVFGIGLHGYAELPAFPGAAFHICWNHYAWTIGRTLVEVFAEHREDETPEQIHDDIVARYQRFVADPFADPDDGATEFADYSFMPGDFTVYCKVSVEPAARSYTGAVSQIVRYTEIAAPNWENPPPLPTGIPLPVWAQLDGTIPISAIPEGPVVDLAESFVYRRKAQ